MTFTFEEVMGVQPILISNHTWRMVGEQPELEPLSPLEEKRVVIGGKLGVVQW